MTKEEAIAYFIDSNERIISVAKDENRYNYETQQIEDVFMRRSFKANEMAIKVLEQESCEDCISREAVLDIDFDSIYLTYARPSTTIRNEIRNLPSVQPKAICEEREKGECPYYAG